MPRYNAFCEVTVRKYAYWILEFTWRDICHCLVHIDRYINMWLLSPGKRNPKILLKLFQFGPKKNIFYAIEFNPLSYELRHKLNWIVNFIKKKEVSFVLFLFVVFDKLLMKSKKKKQKNWVRRWMNSNFYYFFIFIFKAKAKNENLLKATKKKKKLNLTQSSDTTKLLN